MEKISYIGKIINIDKLINRLTVLVPNVGLFHMRTWQIPKQGQISIGQWVFIDDLTNAKLVSQFLTPLHNLYNINTLKILYNR